MAIQVRSRHQKWPQLNETKKSILVWAKYRANLTNHPFFIQPLRLCVYFHFTRTQERKNVRTQEPLLTLNPCVRLLQYNGLEKKQICFLRSNRETKLKRKLLCPRYASLRSVPDSPQYRATCNVCNVCNAKHGTQNVERRTQNVECRAWQQNLVVAIIYTFSCGFLAVLVVVVFTVLVWNW